MTPGLVSDRLPIHTSYSGIPLNANSFNIHISISKSTGASIWFLESLHAELILRSSAIEINDLGPSYLLT